MHGFEDEELKSVDAVIHFAGLPRNLLVPDNETFRVNIIGTYNVRIHGILQIQSSIFLSHS